MTGLKDNVVTQDNKIILGTKYRYTKLETDILFIFLSLIRKDDKENTKYPLHISDVVENVTDKKKSNIKKAISSIRNKSFLIQEEDGVLEAGWLSSIKWYKDGTFDFTIDPRVAPYLFAIKGSFTSSGLSYLLSMKSVYTKKLHIFLESFMWRGRVHVFSLKELHDALDVSDTYRKDGGFRAFNQKVLTPARCEMMDKSNIMFDMEFIKNGGRAVTDIKFNIYKNENVAPYKSELNQFISKLKELHINESLNVKFGKEEKEMFIINNLLKIGNKTLTKEESYDVYERMYDAWVKGVVIGRLEAYRGA